MRGGDGIMARVSRGALGALAFIAIVVGVFLISRMSCDKLDKFAGSLTWPWTPKGQPTAPAEPTPTTTAPSSTSLVTPKQTAPSVAATPEQPAPAPALTVRPEPPKPAAPKNAAPAPSKKQQPRLSFVVFKSDTTRTWKTLGGDPAGIPLAEQITHIPVPASVKDRWIDQVRHSKPDTVWIKRGELLGGITFGGRHSNTFKVWGPTLCAWRDPKTGVPVEHTRALAWPAVAEGDEEFTLLQFLACSNGGYLRTPVPHAEIPTEPTPVQPPSVPVPPVSPRPQPIPDIPAFEPGGREYTSNGTIWMTGELVDGLNDGKHLNGFIGSEVVIRGSYGGHRPGLVARVHAGALGAPNANGEFSDGGGGARLGMRASVFEPALWQWDVEGGGYADLQKLQWRDERMVSPTQLHWDERRSTIGDVGGYARTLGQGPYWTNWDVRGAVGKRLASEVEARVGIEPRPVTFEAGYQRTHYREREVDSHGREFNFPDSEMKMREASVGVRPRSNHRVSVGYRNWNYQSSTWTFDWRGPYTQYDWQFRRSWRFRAGGTWFNDTHETDRRTHEQLDNDHVRITSGLNYDF